MGEAWFRNPTFYIRELVEVGARGSRIVWDRGVLMKQRIDPQKYVNGYGGPTFDYRILLVGPQGSAEIRRESSMQAPTAVYPTFEYGRQKFDQLEQMLAQPAGEDPSWWKIEKDEPDARPVAGQEHRVVIIRSPHAGMAEGRGFLNDLSLLQQEYPEAIVHLHGTSSWRVAFGTGLAAADVECRLVAAKGRVTLPNGREVYTEDFEKWDLWMRAIGYRPADVKQPRDRCIFNIKSALWASDNFERDVYFKTRRGQRMDLFPDQKITETRRKSHPDGPTVSGDKVLCDACSLAPICKLYRDGGVCAIPGTDVSQLIGIFKSRDASRIVDGLGVLMAANVERLEVGLEQETSDGELDPQVSRIIEATFDHGVKLAKLLNPMLGVKISANLAGSVANVTGGSMAGLASGVVAELEAAGIPREQITSEMVTALLERTAARQAAIEAHTSPAV
jgi:hypothetical protein